MFLRVDQDIGRKCGECQMCCEILQIKELEKPVKTKCQHQCASGCAIYDVKPKPCNDFECLWLQGYTGDKIDRPDLLGMMVTVLLHNEEVVLHVWECWDSAFNNPRCMKILKEIGKNKTFVVICYDGKMGIIGTPANNSKFLEKHKVLLVKEE